MIIEQKKKLKSQLKSQLFYIFDCSVYPLISSTKSGTSARVRNEKAAACMVMIGQMQPSHQIAIEYSLNFRLIYHIALCKVLSPDFPIFQ